MQCEPASDRSLLVSLGDSITRETNLRVTRLLRAVAGAELPGIINLHPAYVSLLIVFDPLLTDHASLVEALTVLEHQRAADAIEKPAIEIPVRYGGEFGPDLESVAALNKLTPEEVIRIHCSAEYFVAFLGFTPGFAYLGGLPASIATPRLPAPRRRVVPGSVGIAGNQTGIYPFATPGGWRLIGRTHLEMFRADRPAMSLLSIGDAVRFMPVPELPA